MDSDGSHAMALGRLEGKVETILSLLTAISTRTDTLTRQVNENDKRIASLEAKTDAKSDTVRFWITTLSSGIAVAIAALALAKDVIIK